MAPAALLDVDPHQTPDAVAVAIDGRERRHRQHALLEQWKPGDPSWLTAAQVAEILGVTGPRVSQLARRGFLPYERTPDGRRVFRPAQIEVIARARRDRFHAPPVAAPCGSDP